MEEKIRKYVFKYLPLVIINAILPALAVWLYSFIDMHIIEIDRETDVIFLYIKPFTTTLSYFFKLVISILIVLDLKRNGFDSYWIGLIGLFSLTFALTLLLLTSFPAKYHDYSRLD